jgi:acetyltransferase-like isoleucine patch superfamily enzyme
MRDLWARCRGAWYRLKYQYVLRKAVMEGGLRAYCKLEIKGPGRIHFGRDVRILPTAFGGDHVSLYLNHPESRIRIGNGAILRGTRVGCESVIEIGERAVIESASLFDTDFHNIDASKRDETDEKSSKPLLIGEGAYVGWESCLGKGVSLGSGAVVLPNTVLTWKATAPNVVLLGVPGRVLS